MAEFEYSNGASGECQDCGAETEEEWHQFCGDCYARQNGWRRPDRAALADQHEDRERLTLLRTLELIRSMEKRLEEMHDRVVALEQRVAQLESPAHGRRAA